MMCVFCIAPMAFYNLFMARNLIKQFGTCICCTKYANVCIFYGNDKDNAIYKIKNNLGINTIKKPLGHF